LTFKSILLSRIYIFFTKRNIHTRFINFFINEAVCFSSGISQRHSLTQGYFLVRIQVVIKGGPKCYFSVIDVWRAAGTGFFKTVKISPALPVPDASALGAKIYQSVQVAEAKMQGKK